MDTYLDKGAKGYLSSGGVRVPIEIKDYCGKALQIAFMEEANVGASPWCYLEFEDDRGCARYNTQVCAATYDSHDGLVLVRVSGVDRKGVREFARVPTDMDVTLQSGHGAVFEADLINISSGGALVESDATFDERAEVVMRITVPQETAHKVIGQVVHIEPGENGRTRYGIRFVEAQRDFMRALYHFIWGELKALFPLKSRGMRFPGQH